jgi:hypothetical protein
MVSSFANKKNRENKNIIWHKICYCHIGSVFGTRFAVPAILAENARFLPFWQFAILPFWQVLTGRIR